MAELADDPQTLPAPTAAMVLLRAHIEASIATMGRRKAEKYLRQLAEIIAQEENLSAVFHLRPVTQHADVRKARRQASAMFQGYLPLFLARIPRE